MQNDNDLNKESLGGIYFLVFLALGILLALVFSVDTKEVNAAESQFCNVQKCFTLTISPSRTQIELLPVGSLQQHLIVYNHSSDCKVLAMPMNKMVATSSSAFTACGTGMIGFNVYEETTANYLWSGQLYLDSNNKFYYPSELVSQVATTTVSGAVWSQDSGDIVFGLGIIIFILCLMGMRLVFPKFKM